MHHQSTLSLGIAHSLHRILVIDEVVIRGKQCIEMADLVPRPCYFRALDRQKATALSIFRSLAAYIIKVDHDLALLKRTVVNPMIDCALILIRHIFIQILHKFLLKRSVLDVICDGNDIQSVIPCLIHTERRDDITIRMDRVCMKISLINIVTVHLRQDYFRAETLTTLIMVKDVRIPGILIIRLSIKRTGRCQQKYRN